MRANFKNNLPKGFFLGFRDISGLVYENAFVCNDNGDYLISRLGIRNDGSGGLEFFLKGEDWFSLKDFMISNEIISRIWGNQKIEIFKLEYYRVISWLTGKQAVVLFQEAEDLHYPIPEYKPHVSVGKVTDGSLITAKVEKNYKPPIFQGGPLESGVAKSADVLCNVIEQISEAGDWYHIRGIRNKPDLSFADLFVSDDFYQTHKSGRLLPDGSSIKYSHSYIKRVLTSLAASDSELMDISWFRIDQNGNLKVNKLNQKEFYKTFLKLFQDRFAAGDLLFREFKRLLDGKSFSSFEGFTQDDYELVTVLKTALIEVFGYEAFTMIQLGLLGFSKVNGIYSVNTFIFSKEYLTDIVRIFNLGSLRTRWTSNFDHFSARRNRETFFASLFLSGQVEKIPLISDSGVYRGLEEIYSIPDSIFLDELLIGGFDTSYGEHSFAYHSQIMTSFLARFYSTYDNRLSRSKRIISSKSQMYIELSKLINAQINIGLIREYARGKWVIDHLGNVVWAQVPEFSVLSDQTTWLEITRMFFKLQVLDAIFRPQQTTDPTEALYQLFKKGYAQKIHLATGSTAKNLLVVYEDLILNKGIFNDESLMSMRHTLPFRYQALIGGSQFAKKNHHLFVESIWYSIDDAVIHTANRLQDIISSSNSEHITVFFHKASNSGFSNMGSRLKDRVFQSDYPGVPNYIHGEMKVDPQAAIDAGYDEVDGTALEFENLREDGSNVNQFLQNIYSIVYYMVKYNSFIMVKEGKQFNNRINSNGFLLFGDLYNLYGNEIIKTLRINALSFGLSPLGRSMLNNYIAGYTDAQGIYHEAWNSDINHEPVWKDSNRFPIWLFSNHKEFRELFKVRTGFEPLNLQ